MDIPVVMSVTVNADGTEYDMEYVPMLWKEAAVIVGLLLESKGCSSLVVTLARPKEG